MAAISLNPGGAAARPRTPFAGLCDEAKLLITSVDLAAATAGPLRDDAAILETITQGLESRDRGEQIAAAIEVRKQLAAALPDPEARRTMLELRERYFVAVGTAGKAQYLQQQPAHSEPPPLGDVIAEIRDLLNRLQLVFAVSRARDHALRSLRSWALAGLIGLLLLVFALGPIHSPGANYVVIAAWGSIGALVSVMRRSQKVADLSLAEFDPVSQISALHQGWLALAVAALLGPMFSIVLFAVFAAQMLQVGALTPTIIGATPDLAQFTILDHALRFATDFDAAKMAVWAFLAGFAEQLVPDVLDRFSSDLQGGGKA